MMTSFDYNYQNSFGLILVVVVKFRHSEKFCPIGSEMILLVSVSHF